MVVGGREQPLENRDGRVVGTGALEVFQRPEFGDGMQHGIGFGLVDHVHDDGAGRDRRGGQPQLDECSGGFEYVRAGGQAGIDDRAEVGDSRAVGEPVRDGGAAGVRQGAAMADAVSADQADQAGEGVRVGSGGSAQGDRAQVGVGDPVEVRKGPGVGVGEDAGGGGFGEQAGYRDDGRDEGGQVAGHGAGAFTGAVDRVAVSPGAVAEVVGSAEQPDDVRVGEADVGGEQIPQEGHVVVMLGQVEQVEQGVGEAGFPVRHGGLTEQGLAGALLARGPRRGFGNGGCGHGSESRQCGEPAAKDGGDGDHIDVDSGPGRPGTLSSVHVCTLKLDSRSRGATP